ncbi:hypothetical protein KIPB_001088 [Kipferlia bialata]|uniref:Calcineurin-like phosphoesterase domain-containing protein n=1 Tax=Kipferlia bialata TaxID=797122 RepID=A0A9K3CND3_9EUKA|nr:hypothetical protein KIPB_001088 [Kipferlia bialata]|eukprot:g1088.t1
MYIMPQLPVAVRRVTVDLTDRKTGDGPVQTTSVALFSDTHWCGLVPMRVVRQTVDALNGLKADAVVFAGDMSDGGPVPSVVSRIAELTRIEAPLFGVTGNHEAFDKPRAMINTLKNAGRMHVLENEWADSTPKAGPLPIVICGAHDTAFGQPETSQTETETDVVEGYQSVSNSPAGSTQVKQRGVISPAQPTTRKRLVCDIEGTLSSAPCDRPRLLLCHNPDRRTMAQAADAGADIVCSGHTHAGQVWPFNIAVRIVYKQFFAGHSLVESDRRDHPMHAVVTSGAGCWGPQQRFPSRNEICLLTVLH